MTSNLIKYPKTPHLPFSQGVQDDDKVIKTLNGFVGHTIVVTEKLDGENTTMYYNHIHARSLDSRHHPSRDWVKGFWGQRRHQIPTGWRICGENVYAQHSIAYTELDTFFYGFSIWDDHNVALSWESTLFWFETLRITPVPTLYRGAFDLEQLKKIVAELDTSKQEGFVVRVEDKIAFDEFDLKCAKWVRSGHVQTDEHWMNGPVIPNHLKKEIE